MTYFFLVTIFLSSFLLFAVQPMLAKLLLPSFGGGSAIWTACMIFYQGFLLLGYLYAHGLTKLKSQKHQIMIHFGLLMLGAVLMPLNPIGAQEFELGGDPYWRIFKLSFFMVGMPYFILSTTSPLLQYWLSHSADKTQTYRLYSVSNVAALLALFCYPFLLEATFTLETQLNLWSLGFWLFGLSMVACLIVLVRSASPSQVRREPTPDIAAEKTNRPSGILVSSWFLLAAMGVVLLVSVTNNITLNIPPIPFLWTLPLAIYLVTYILSFFDERIYHRAYWNLAFALVALMGVLLFFIGTHFNLITQLVLYLLILFVGCMICHGEIARSKPDGPYLTLFYLVLAAGGFAGSLFTSVIATRIFTQYYEFILGLAGVFLLVTLMIRTFEKDNRKVMAIPTLGLGVFVLLFGYLQSQFTQFNVYETRNFYGILQVKDLEHNGQKERRLIDGYTSHGTQSLLNKVAPIPMSYYRFETGIGISLMALKPEQRERVGIIGLGVGALAFYGQANDRYVYYELNPSVETVAKDYFDFLATSVATLEVRLGDARVTLEKELVKSGGQGYQVLVVDAFSSDAIPMHLLTEEALALYTNHLAEDGVLAFHVSNSYLDLKPVLLHHAKKLGLTAIYFKTAANEADPHGAEWVMLSNNADYLSQAEVTRMSVPLEALSKNVIRWTDNYSSLLSVVKY